MVIPLGSSAVHPAGAFGRKGINRLKSTALTLPGAGLVTVTAGEVVPCVLCCTGSEPPGGEFVIHPATMEAPIIRITTKVIQLKQDMFSDSYTHL
jgi:hypothetical protein